MLGLDMFRDELHSIGIPYEFMMWTNPVEDRYWVGEYSEFTPTTENGFRETSIILTGTTRGSWLSLEKDRKAIERHFDSIFGLSRSNEEGTVIFYYENAHPVPTGEAELKRLQINLLAQEWRKA
jgi:hypothetical protein